MLAVLALVLRRHGYVIETAFDGYDGLKKAREFKPDLIILDILLPDIDGYEVCRHLKNNPETAAIGVIMLSAVGGEEEGEQEWAAKGKVHNLNRGFDAGALEYITKPFQIKELAQRVKAVLWAAGITA